MEQGMWKSSTGGGDGIEHWEEQDVEPDIEFLMLSDDLEEDPPIQVPVTQVC